MFNLFFAIIASLGNIAQYPRMDNNKEKLIETKMKDISDSFENATSSQYPNATFIDNAFYFDNCHYYADNNDGICGIVAAQIILNYYDTFQNDNLIDEQYDAVSQSTSAVTDLSGWMHSPGSGESIIYQNSQSFSDVLTDVAEDSLLINVNDGMTAGEVRTLLHNYTNSRELSAVVTELPMISSSFNTFIEERIDENEPMICCVPNHFVVVYGYDDNYFYFDTGYKYSARAPKSLFNVLGFSLCVRYQFTADHVHSDNYYHYPSRSFKCGCGEIHYKMLDMKKEFWDFESQYYFYNKNKQHYQDGLSFNSSRLRTGFIEETAINLSPRRSGAGVARFDIVLPYNIKQFSVNMAWWSEYEHQNDGDAMLMYREEDEWQMYCVNLLTEGLSLSKNNMSLRSYILNPDTDAISFYLINSATGDRNSGRLSLGDMKIEYCLD